MSERSDAGEERSSEASATRTAEPNDDSGGNGSFLGDLLGSVFAVAVIGLLLFAISGVWPPMVAIESASMEDNINTGDLVFIMDEHRFPSQYQTGDTGVVTAATGREVGYYKFNRPGDVIVYEPSGNGGATPVIHRAVFWVNESENWYGKADQRYIPPDADGCDELGKCPAPNEGFVTLGDNNAQYDQIGPGAVSEPVRPEWVVGTAEFRLPGLGWLRLKGTGAVGSADAAALAA